MTKPTKWECIQVAHECEKQAKRYLKHSQYYQSRLELDRAANWANLAASRTAEAKTLHEYAENL